jgi:Uma2 family endonuclease
VGETDWHILALLLLREGLEDFFADRPDVKVASDMFLYYRKGDPSANKAPDTMIIKGVGKQLRRSFKTWIERAVPCVIIEITSEKTWQEDLGDKRDVYEQLGVKEYFVLDPEAMYLEPPLQGFRLKGKRYVPLAPAADGSLLSKELELRLRAENYMLRLLDAATGQPVPTRVESWQLAQRQTELERAEKERERLRAEVERAEKERESLRAEQEKRRADALEAELTRLRAQVKGRGRKKSS